jgi:hypothetical protein
MTRHLTPAQLQCLDDTISWLTGLTEASTNEDDRHNYWKAISNLMVVARRNSPQAPAGVVRFPDRGGNVVPLRRQS